MSDTLPSHVGVNCCASIHPPADGPGQSAGDDQQAWTAAAHMGELAEAPSSVLATQPSGQRTSARNMTCSRVSPLLSVTAFQINKQTF